MLIRFYKRQLNQASRLITFDLKILGIYLKNTQSNMMFLMYLKIWMLQKTIFGPQIRYL